MPTVVNRSLGRTRTHRSMRTVGTRMVRSPILIVGITPARRAVARSSAKTERPASNSYGDGWLLRRIPWWA